jgi:protein crumbs
MKREIQSMLAAVTLALASPVLMAEENSGNDSGPSPQARYGPGYGMGPGMMYGPGYGPGYGMGPGMMHRPGYGPGYGMGPGMMYGPGYGQEPDSVDDTNRPYWGPGMMYGPNYGGRR